ncbi:MAG: DUF5689 domain-containing protein [Saprospiraceae bacterium]
MFFQKNKNLAISLLAASFLAVSFIACVKTDFDQPPVGGNGQDIPTNISILALKKLHSNFTGGYRAITEEYVIGGTVVMDDRSGNYYKALVIQDSTGGIEIQFGNGYLYNRYPIGRKIYIKCKGLMLTDYNGLVQLVGGFYEENGQKETIGLTENQEINQIVRGFLGGPLAPKPVKISQLSLDMVGTFIQLDGVQFSKCDAGRIYADAVTKTDINRTLEDCADNAQVYLRSSAYSDFAIKKTATGQGSLVGVLGIYSTNNQVTPTDFQLYIRDLRDVNMAGARCDDAIGGTQTNISEIRSQFIGTTTTVSGSKKITGVVISDRINNNLNARNLYLQDGSAGIVVRFLENHCYDLGDEIEVDVSGQELSEFNKLLQVNNVPSAKSQLIRSGVTVAPRIATIADVIANFDAWESTLVKISGATISGATSVYSGNKTLSDGTGTIPMFTQSSSTFANTPIPTAPVNITAIVSDFNGKQVILRNLLDVQ